jgi:hypothetical protein
MKVERLPVRCLKEISFGALERILMQTLLLQGCKLHRPKETVIVTAGRAIGSQDPA